MSYLQQEQEVFVRKLQRGEMTRSALDTFLRIAHQSVSITFTNLQRLSDLVLIFRQLDVHRSGEEMRSLKHKFPGLPHQIGITGDDALTLESFPGAFSQIVSSLLMNALIHAYGKDEQGRIQMTLKRDGQMLQLELRDDGRGISLEHLSKIFDPFFTTARGQGGQWPGGCTSSIRSCIKSFVARFSVKAVPAKARVSCCDCRSRSPNHVNMGVLSDMNMSNPFGGKHQRIP